jgi:hypothetical protein
VFPVMYNLNFYTLFRINLVFGRLTVGPSISFQWLNTLFSRCDSILDDKDFNPN